MINLFKNFIGGLKYKKENKGIQDKKGNELVKFNLAEGSSIKGDVLINLNGKKIIEKKNKNLDMISEASISNEQMESVEDFDHIIQIKNFIETGANSTDEVANFVKTLMNDIFNEKEYSKRKDITLAVEFLKESSKKEKSILVWSYIINIIPSSDLNVITFKNNIHKIRSHFPFFEKIDSDEDLNIFTRFGAKPDGNWRNIIFTDKMDEFFENIFKKNFSSKDEFYSVFPEFKKINENYKKNNVAKYDITKLAPFIGRSLKIAAHALLKSVGFNFV